MPTDAVPGSFRPADADALVRLHDGTWLSMQVLGWRKDTADRWSVQLRWHIVGVTTMEEWFIYDPARIQAEGLMSLSCAPRSGHCPRSAAYGSLTSSYPAGSCSGRSQYSMLAGFFRCPSGRSRANAAW
jgi:hypothetical protein